MVYDWKMLLRFNDRYKHQYCLHIYGNINVIVHLVIKCEALRATHEKNILFPNKYIHENKVTNTLYVKRKVK